MKAHCAEEGALLGKQLCPNDLYPTLRIGKGTLMETVQGLLRQLACGYLEHSIVFHNLNKTRCWEVIVFATVFAAKTIKNGIPGSSGITRARITSTTKAINIFYSHLSLVAARSIYEIVSSDWTGISCIACKVSVELFFTKAR